jgi:hypothetical protein
MNTVVSHTVMSLELAGRFAMLAKIIDKPCLLATAGTSASAADLEP